MADKIKDYPFLFHKYVLSLANPTDPIPYTVIKEGTQQAHICHFHIFNIDQYDAFQPHIDLILKHYSIIITYCTGTLSSIDFPTSITLLHCLNKGYDIGGKFCALDYLQSKSTEYEYILFLHFNREKKVNLFFLLYDIIRFMRKPSLKKNNMVLRHSWWKKVGKHVIGN